MQICFFVGVALKLAALVTWHNSHRFLAGVENKQGGDLSQSQNMGGLKMLLKNTCQGF